MVELASQQTCVVPLLPSSSLLSPPPPPGLAPGLPSPVPRPGEEGGAGAEEVTEVVSEDGAAEAVDEGVVAAVAHGQPVGDEEDEVDVFILVDLRPAHAG